MDSFDSKSLSGIVTRPVTVCICVRICSQASGVAGAALAPRFANIKSPVRKNGAFMGGSGSVEFRQLASGLYEACEHAFTAPLTH